MSRHLPEAEIQAYLHLCAYTLAAQHTTTTDTLARQWAEDDARWLWEAPQGLRSTLPLYAVRQATEAVWART